MKITTHVLPLTSVTSHATRSWARPDQSALLDMVSQSHGGSVLPSEFPSVIEGPTAWSGLDSGSQELFILELSEQDVTDVEDALEAFKDLEMDGDEVTREHFPLPNLESRLDRCALEVHHGTGLCLIRGLDPQKYCDEDKTLIFLGMSSYIGEHRGLQNSKGLMLSHVNESKSWTIPRTKRHGIHTNESLPFHADMGCEILSIQVRQCAETGGRTCVASSGAIYNDLMQTNPKTLRILARSDWPIQTSFKQRGSPYILCPLLAFHDGNLILSMDPARIGPHPSGPAGLVPTLTLEQRQALVVLQGAAQRHQVRLINRPGDLVYLNNWSLLHAREAYHDTGTSSRHLVRLWLRNETLGWSIPASMKGPWESSFGAKARRVVNRRYPVAPMPEYMESKYTNGTAAFMAEDDDEPEPETQSSVEEDTKFKAVPSIKDVNYEFELASLTVDDVPKTDEVFLAEP